MRSWVAQHVQHTKMLCESRSWQTRSLRPKESATFICLKWIVRELKRHRSSEERSCPHSASVLKDMIFCLDGHLQSGYIWRRLSNLSKHSFTYRVLRYWLNFRKSCKNASPMQCSCQGVSAEESRNCWRGWRAFEERHQKQGQEILWTEDCNLWWRQWCECKSAPAICPGFGSGQDWQIMERRESAVCWHTLHGCSLLLQCTKSRQRRDDHKIWYQQNS